MGSVLEIIRRLAVVMLWVIGGGFALLVIIEGANKSIDPEEQVSIGVIMLFGVFILHKVVNWILLKDEKKAPPE